MGVTFHCQEPGITLEILNEQLTWPKSEIRGPAGTSYEDGIFQLDIKIPDAYPFRPPKVKFITKVWHPYVSSQTGDICLDILAEQWCPAQSLRTVLLSIQSVLGTPPVPSDPMDSFVARQYMNNKEIFESTAKFWTQHFAH